ncbi:uncharacterized protein si:dkey-262k9.2 isoform X2 [Eleginops maclovinus]
MMRLLFLCLLLMLPAASAVSEFEGSADEVPDDDEDSTVPQKPSDSHRAKSSTEVTDQFTVIGIVVAVAILTLSVAAVIIVLLVRRNMHNREQGVYSVPTEQDQKGTI